MRFRPLGRISEDSDLGRWEPTPTVMDPGRELVTRMICRLGAVVLEMIGLQGPGCPGGFQ